MRNAFFTVPVLTLVVVGTSACAAVTADLPADLPAAEPMVTVTLNYVRPPAYRPTGRPAAFEVVQNYTSASAVDEYTGSWDDQTQTLTAPVTVALKAENLVYVVDEAVPGGVQTPIFLHRVGQLHEISCTPDVPSGHACYLLQVLN